MGVISVVVFPFPVGYSNPEFRLNINFIPFSFGSCFDYLPEICLRTIYENILLTIPFGFGISFIARIKPQNIIWLAVAVGLTFEIIQLLISLIVRNSFRSVDINDVILNTIGVLVGYAVFRVFGWLYFAITEKFEIRHKNVFAYVYDVVCHTN